MKNKNGSPESRISSRALNRRLLLQLLQVKGPMSRAELAVAADLSPAAVTNVTSSLLEDRLIEETSTPRESGPGTKIGRPGTLLMLSASTPAVLIVHVWARAAEVAIADLRATVLGSEVFPVERHVPAEQILEQAAEVGERLLSNLGIPESAVIGAGVGVPGLVDRQQRTALHAELLGWNNVPIADFFEARLGVPTVVEQTVRSMAMGEVRYGLSQGLESIAFVYVRTGVGAALVLGGREYRGGTHGAVELGHVRVHAEGVLCVCGSHGCLETVLGDDVIQAELQLHEVPGSESEDRGQWVKAFIKAVEDGHPGALQVRGNIVSNLTAALLSVVNLLNPERIVLAGLLDELSDIVLDPLRQRLAHETMPVLREGVRVERATFGARAGVVGIAASTLDRFVFGEPLLNTQN